MFLVASTGEGRAPLERARAALVPHLPCGEVHVVALGPERELAWFRARAADALHLFDDGVIIGTLVLDEDTGNEPVVHHEALPGAVGGLVTAVRVTADGMVRPENITNVYWHGERASDSQMVLAHAGGLRPSTLGVALLAGVGFLPGEETLFEEVRRIRLLHQLDLATGGMSPTGGLPRPVPDELGDDALVDHLASLLPAGGDHCVALSGGIDSRVVLGLVMAAGLDPLAVSTRNRMDDHVVAEEVAGQAGVSVRVSPEGEALPQAPDEVHTLLTDAQIYFGGTRWSRLTTLVPPGSVVHFGMMGECLFKNAFKSAWKPPTSKASTPLRTVDRGLLSGMRAQPAGLRTVIPRERLAGLLRERMAPLDDLVPLETRAQHADWLHFHSRSVRWAQASMAELTSARGVGPGDLTAWMIASRSRAWDNHAHVRGRRLAHRLLPSVTEPYQGGLAAAPPTGVPGATAKISYEYVTRLQSRRAARSRPPVSSVTRAVEDPGSTPEGFDEHFVSPLDGLTAVGAGLPVRRAARTVADVLRYLDDR